MTALNSVQPTWLSKRLLCLAAGLTLLTFALGEVRPQQAAPLQTLRIGTSPAVNIEAGKGKASTTPLRDFIKEETKLNSEIFPQKSWQELAQKMANKEIEVGVFEGYEFAYAQPQFSTLKPLALAVNGSDYQTAHLVGRKDSPATALAALQGQNLAAPTTNSSFPWYFLEQQTQAMGKKPDAFFGKILKPGNAEDALDDVVDGVVGCAVVDRAALEAYKRRKPGRMAQLKDVVHSEQVPAPVIAYVEGALDKATLDRFRNGLLRANQAERGQTLLTMFRLTGFATPPANFDQLLTATRKAYPPLSAEK
jgi:ABC-type phosphate/phosphonate transport system substrate-binding protein